MPISAPRSKSNRRDVEPKVAPPRNHREEFLTPTEAANRLLVAPVTVRMWATKGLLPYVMTPGGHRRFRATDVDAFAAKHQGPTERADDSPEPTKPSRLLIIDDDAQYARYLSSLVATHLPDIAVDVALDGFSAGIKCQALRPDIVTLDLQMPDMNGFQVCAQLRDMFGTGKPRILALTGFATPANVQRIIAAGADACFSKSTSADDLLRELSILPARQP